MEARKIAIACFVGGVLFTVVAFFVARQLWWLGIPAGFISGYLAYEFRMVLSAAPGAFAAAFRESDLLIRSFLISVRNFFRTKHPFAYPTAAVATGTFLFIYHRVAIVDIHPDRLAVAITLGTLAAIVTMMLVPMVLWVLACFGANFVRVYFDWTSGGSDYERAELRKKGYKRTANIRLLHAKGYRYVRVTYLNVLCWVPLGVVAIIRFVAWTIPKNAVILIGLLAWMILRAIWLLVIAIHSHKRVLCGLDGTLGGALSYWLFVMNHWFFAGELSLGERALVVVFGGLLGAVIGIANWEFVSKRLLKVAT